MIHHLLIANRGEIAIRIIKSAKKMGIATTAIYADQDRDAYFVKCADDAVALNGHTLTETYLDIEKITSIAKGIGAEAIHPGYGFLSENADFANACGKKGLIFVGPPVSAIELMGNKIASRDFAEKAGVPLLKGISGNTEDLLSQLDELTFPVIIKAAAGGGGKGMRVVRSQDDVAEALKATSREALSYFGDGSVFIERFIEQPRHIEVQVLGDKHGNIVHLFERECTIQRRHQKIIEEAPSITLNEQTRHEITASAVALAKAAGYYSAGTVEYIMDEAGKFYFMEMNTRVQVEHPVTEMITGVDIIEQQMRIASGEILPFAQKDISRKGHAIECRIYAEDPTNDFRPSPGKLLFFKEPEMENVRTDSSFPSSANVPKLAFQILPDYDPMIAKMIGYGNSREEALKNTAQALDAFHFYGTQTNRDYLRAILVEENFKSNNISTNYCKLHHTDLLALIDKLNASEGKELHIIGSYVSKEFTPKGTSIWTQSAIQQGRVVLDSDLNEEYVIRKISNLEFQISNAKDHKTLSLEPETLNAKPEGVYAIANNRSVVFIDGSPYVVERLDALDYDIDYLTSATSESSNLITAPIPGTVIKILLQEGDVVDAGQNALILEAMKMENTLKTAVNGTVKSINIREGDKVESGKVLVEVDEIENEE